MRSMSSPPKFRLISLLLVLVASVCWPQWAAAGSEGWVTSWAGSVQGPYPIGNPSLQPNLSLVFPSAQIGAKDQSFRMIVRPDIWASQTRIRLSNALGTQPVTFDGVFVGLHQSSSALVAGTNQAVQFGGKSSVTIAPGAFAWSDPVPLRFVNPSSVAAMAGRKLAVSFHVVDESGPMTWHAKAMSSSYVSAPNAGAKGNDEGEAPFPFATASWYFLDAVDMMAAADTRVILAFGDSITDGTAATINGDDRWTDVLSRRLHATFGNKLVVVNAGISGNQVAGPAEYSAQSAFSGGPSAGQRLERDVLTLSGVTAMIWLEGINDLSKNGNRDSDVVKEEMKTIIERIRAKRPNLKIIGATVTTALGSTSAGHGSAEQNSKRLALNDFIRNSGLFDAVIDFDKVILDPQSGGMRTEFVPDNTRGGDGDKLHPNRLGYLAMGMSIDLKMLLK